MTVDEAVQVFSELQTEAKIEFLSSLAFELTCVARNAYDTAGIGVTNGQWIREVNEIQHRVIGRIRGIFDHSAQYPDDVLFSMILGSDNSQLRREIGLALDRAFKTLEHGVRS